MNWIKEGNALTYYSGNTFYRINLSNNKITTEKGELKINGIYARGISTLKKAKALIKLIVDIL